MHVLPEGRRTFSSPERALLEFLGDSTRPRLELVAMQAKILRQPQSKSSD
jgi:hypothetical protein